MAVGVLLPYRPDFTAAADSIKSLAGRGDAALVAIQEAIARLIDGLETLEKQFANAR